MYEYASSHLHLHLHLHSPRITPTKNNNNDSERNDRRAEFQRGHGSGCGYVCIDFREGFDSERMGGCSRGGRKGNGEGERETPPLGIFPQGLMIRKGKVLTLHTPCRFQGLMSIRRKGTVEGDQVDEYI